ncbi:hypothetical protein NECAME_00983 [Necator americanus]|uniref:Uncharacterized protein n=1 Tax=Necator americanus TaxID=51031 RepID=W2SK95_NECAM|nr:hypothetical protein NECAME_00983 [Necator americanus]ETN70035.1 hypothetical protein NECAME_00983 [Necator americanus]
MSAAPRLEIQQLWAGYVTVAKSHGQFSPYATLLKAQIGTTVLYREYVERRLGGAHCSNG